MPFPAVLSKTQVSRRHGVSAAGPVQREGETPHHRLGQRSGCTYGPDADVYGPGLPIVFSGSAVGFDQPPPGIGEHNGEVYGDLLGYTQSELRELQSRASSKAGIRMLNRTIRAVTAALPAMADCAAPEAQGRCGCAAGCGPDCRRTLLSNSASGISVKVVSIVQGARYALGSSMVTERIMCPKSTRRNRSMTRNASLLGRPFAVSIQPPSRKPRESTTNRSPSHVPVE